MPITQYFENARQAGLIRYSSSSGETDSYLRGDEHDLYAVDFKKPVQKVTSFCFINFCESMIIISQRYDYGEICNFFRNKYLLCICVVLDKQMLSRVMFEKGHDV